MKECMNCGGPVADTDTHCTTCGLERGKVIFGERPWDDEPEEQAVRRCEGCGNPLPEREVDTYCIDCEEEMW